MAARNVLSFSEAAKPEFTDRQVEFCDRLIGMGLTRLCIAGLVCNCSVKELDHAEISSANRLISKRKKHLGYGIMDARRVQSPWMIAAVRDAARNMRIRVRVA